MTWTIPEFDARRVNTAGKFMLRCAHDPVYLYDNFDAYRVALGIINNFRASHAYPLNTFQVNLRNTARRFDENPLIAQRIKRITSIINKLDLHPSMKLSQMQDLGGCRAILGNVTSVRNVIKYYINESAIKHTLVSYDDYVTFPKTSGYRGAHLVYRYFSDKNKYVYNGKKIELQIRSRYQHAWATAVETVGMFSGQALKSSLGSEDWKRFFSLMGSVIAMRENTALVPNTPTNKTALVEELRHVSDELKVQSRLHEYNRAVHSIANGSARAYYYLLQLDPDSMVLQVTGYTERQRDIATAQYAEAERIAKDAPGTDAVLVSVESVDALAKAYPNYFADTRLFLALLKQALEGRTRSIRVSDLKVSAQLSLFD